MDVNSTESRAVKNSIMLARLKAKLDAPALDLKRLEAKLDRLISVHQDGSSTDIDGNGSGRIPASFAGSQGYGWTKTVSGAGPRCLAHRGHF